MGTKKQQRIASSGDRRWYSAATRIHARKRNETRAVQRMLEAVDVTATHKMATTQRNAINLRRDSKVQLVLIAIVARLSSPGNYPFR